MIRPLAIVIVGTLASSASGQIAPLVPALGGKPIVGLCLLSREAIFANAKVGAAATAQLRQISDQAQAEIDAERLPLDADVKAFQSEAAKLPAAQRDGRERALAARLQAAQAKAQQRSREIEATRGTALARISAAAQPVIAQVYAAHACGLLVDRNTVLGGNVANDLTAEVVTGLDAKITTISLARETVPATGVPTTGAPR